MEKIPLQPDFREFLKLLNDHEVKYLLIGGYAVGYHGYVRATADLDVWISQDEANASRLIKALKAFGFDDPDLSVDTFLEKRQVVRMGVPPIRIEIQTSISGVSFDNCYEEKVMAEWEDISVPVISLEKLKENKRASGRMKDLTDLEYLE